jgi:hypothetical protein
MSPDWRYPARALSFVEWEKEKNAEPQRKDSTRPAVDISPLKKRKGRWGLAMQTNVAEEDLK